MLRDRGQDFGCFMFFHSSCPTPNYATSVAAELWNQLLFNSPLYWLLVDLTSQLVKFGSEGLRKIQTKHFECPEPPGPHEASCTFVAAGKKTTCLDGDGFG
jgi:hypothetical protein